MAERAVATYVTPVVDSLTKQLPDCPPGLIDLYALLALTRGTQTTLEDVHDAWAMWQHATNPGHPYLIPFAQLTHEVQQLDAPFAAAIRMAALEVSHRG